MLRLVDTSVWVDHLRAGDAALETALMNNQVATHIHVIGEIALGFLKNRKTILSLLRDLPQTTLATDDEVQTLIEERQLYSLGVGYVDCHVLASVLLSPGVQLWTRDKRLYKAAHGVLDGVQILSD